MLFNSFAFLAGFLPVALLLYFGLGRLSAPRWANLSLVLTSLFFYGYWRYDGAGLGGEAVRLYGYVGLLIASTVLNYGIGRRLHGSPAPGLLFAGVAANLAVLGYFKYFGFGVRTVNEVFGTSFPAPSIILPLALSFYTFTQIAFLVDAKRGLAAEMNFPRYCLFVFFFPHLIAGPIVHHSEIMPQFAKKDARRWQWGNIAAGIGWLTLGLIKKVLIADAFAPYANTVFANAREVTGVEAWCGVLAYTFQLYFDFSGYSDMAIGLSLFFNIRLPDNFDAPYRATNIIDFWRRWHMTLSRFLRDYLYIPLGGNRKGPVRRYLNLVLTMVLGGIWHGAGWTFLIWGAFHGLLLAGNHLWQGLKRPMPVWLGRAITFVCVMIGWALFRAKDLGDAGAIIGAMFGARSFHMANLVTGLQLETIVALLAVLIFVNVAPTTKQWIETREIHPARAIVMALLFCIALFLVRNVELQFARSEFIYFQF